MIAYVVLAMRNPLSPGKSDSGYEKSTLAMRNPLSPGKSDSQISIYGKHHPLWLLLNYTEKDVGNGWISERYPGTTYCSAPGGGDLTKIHQ